MARKIMVLVAIISAVAISSFVYAWSPFSGGSGGGDMYKSTYDTDKDGQVNSVDVDGMTARTTTTGTSLDSAVMLWSTSGTNYKMTGENVLDWIKQGINMAFTDLSDTPSTLAGNGNKYLVINAGGTAIEFTSVTSTSGINVSAMSALETTSGLESVATNYVLWDSSGTNLKMTAENMVDWIVTFSQPLEATLTDIADGTIAENLVNTANPWADNEVSDTLTIGASGSVSSSALDADLGALAALATSGGAAVRTASNTWALRSIAISGAGLDVTNGSGIAGNPTVALDVTPSSGSATLEEAEDALQVKYTANHFTEGAGGLALTSSDTARTALGLAIGTDVQAYNATLAAVAGGTYSGDDTISIIGTVTTGGWNGTPIDGDYINILATDTTITERANSDFILIWDTSGTTPVKMTVGNFVTGLGGSGSSIVFDIGDDGGNDSIAVSEIATNGDTNAIFTEPSADKIYIDLSKDWPKADVADVASTGDSATSFFSTGTLESGLLPSAATLDEEWNTEAEVQTVWGSVNILLETEIDASSELAALMDDEQGTGYLVFNNTPTLVTPVLGAATGTSLALGTDPADAGTIRMANAEYIYAEAAPAGTDISVIGVDSGEIVQIGASGASGVTITPATTITGALTASSTVGVATSCNPDEAGGATLGTTSLEWTGLYIGDNTGINLGLGQDWLIAYDEATSDALEFTHTAGAGADVTFDLNDNAAASTFNIINSDGTYAANLSVDGNISCAGTITSSASGDSYVSLANNTTITGSGYQLLFEGGVFKAVENGTERTILNTAASATITATSWDLSAVTNFEIPNGAAPTTDAFGEIAADNNAWASGRGALQVFDGTANTWVVATLTTDTPENGQVPKWNTGGTITWEADNSAGSPTIDAVGDAAAAADIDFDISETMTWNYTGNYTTGTQFLIEQKTGNPTGGTLFEVKAADSDTVAASFGDGTNKINISSTGALTLAGTASITAATAAISALTAVDSLDATGAADMDYGSADVTDHTFIADGGTVVIDGSIQFPDANASPDAVGELLYDNTITGLDDGGLVWYDDDEVQIIVSLDSSATIGESQDGYQVTYNYNSGNGYFTLAAAGSGGGGLSNVVEDTTPQLGGDLDLNGFSIIAVPEANPELTLSDLSTGVIHFKLDSSTHALQIIENSSTIATMTSAGVTFTPAVTLTAGGDFNDADITSADRISGIDATEFIDLGADGYVVVDAGTAINLDSSVQAGDGTYSWGHTPAFGIEGILEVDGAAYFDGAATVAGAFSANGAVNLGDGGDMIKAFHLADFAADRDYSAIDGCIAYAGTSGISVGTLVSLVSIANSTGVNMPVKIASSMGGAAQYCPAQYIVVSIIDGSGNGTTTAWGGTCRVMSIGKIRIPSASYTTGAPLYLSTTGTVTATAPTTSLYNRQIVGYACDTNIADIRLNNVWTTLK